MAKNITLLGANYSAVPSVNLPQTGGGTASFFDVSDTTATASDVTQGKIFLTADGTLTTGTGSGGGGTMLMGVIRPDAELVQSWSYDKMLVADEALTIPSYSTSNQTIRAAYDLGTHTADPLTYRYFIVARCLTIPQYSIATLAKGREEYVFGVGVYEWVYNPADQIQTLDGSKKYGQYSQILTLVMNREIYWSSATAIGLYTSNAYCLNQSLTAPAISSNKTITIKAPSIAIRGHATYLTQTFFNAITDARLQYKIELYRAAIAQNVINGWTHTSCTDSILTNIKNGGTLT